MNWLDITILVICVAGMIQGLVRGFVQQAFTLLGFVFAIILAFRYHDSLAGYLERWIQHPTVLTVVSFAIILGIVVLVFKLLGLAARAIITAIHIGWLDRLAGAAFGLINSVLLVALLFALFVMCADKPTRPVAESILAPRIMYVSHTIARFLPIELRERYRKNESEIRRHMKREAPGRSMETETPRAV